MQVPTRPGLGSPLRPCWDKMSRAVFLKTRAEKVAHSLRKSQPTLAGRLAGSEGSEGSEGSVYEPLCAFLRAVNVYGGGFFLSGGSRVPKFVQQYAERKAREEEEDDQPLQ